MNLKNRLKVDLQKLSDYEKKLRLFAKEVDLKSREARKLGRKEVDKFAKQVQRRRLDLEKKIQAVVENEKNKINERVNEFLNRLLSVSTAPKKGAKRKKGKSPRTRRGRNSKPSQPSEKAPY